MDLLTDPRPHDLLRISPSGPLLRGGPSWVERALRRAPWVVVRRAATGPGFIPVGVRGTSRDERHPGLIRAEDVIETVSPAALLDRISELSDVPAATALRCAVDVLNPAGVEWGPGGSIGFSLASGVTVVTPDSDLDLVIRLHGLPQPAELGRWYDGLSRLPARVDCQLDLPVGGIALTEFVGPSGHVLLRTATGPRLVTRSELR